MIRTDLNKSKLFCAKPLKVCQNNLLLKPAVASATSTDFQKIKLIKCKKYYSFVSSRFPLTKLLFKKNHQWKPRGIPVLKIHILVFFFAKKIMHRGLITMLISRRMKAPRTKKLLYPLKNYFSEITILNLFLYTMAPLLLI